MAEEKNYQNNSGGITQVSNLKLKLGYWYINNKLRLRQALVIFLILLSVGFYGFTFYRASVIVFIDDKNLTSQLDELTGNAIDYTHFHRANAPQDIEIISFDSADGRNNRYDFIAKLANNNSDFLAANVDLILVAGNQPVVKKSVFILPNEEKLVVFFGQEMKNFSNPTLRIEKVQWSRQRNYAEFAEPRLRFEISEADFLPATGGFSNTQPSVSTLNFKVKNNSAFGYWEVGVYVGLVSAGNIVAANFVTLDQFQSGETREVEMRWFEPLPAITDFEIYPEVNILDDGVYMSVR